ncbi:hypothetical protein D9M71_659870 [compost metagenome]
MCLPKARFGQYAVDTGKCLLQTFKQCAEKPLQPGSDIQRAFLARFEDVVIAGSVVEDACGHGVKTDGLLFALGQRQVCDGASKTAVAVIEGVQGDKPEVGDAGA